MDVESDVECGVVSEFVFMVRNPLNVHRFHLRGIVHDKSQTRHLPFNLQLATKASGWHQSQP